MICTIHRLIQDAVRRRWHGHQWQRAIDLAVFILRQVYPRQILGQSMASQYADCDGFNAHLLSVERYFTKCPHSITASVGFAEALAHGGWYYHERGQVPVALGLLRTAESICVNLGAPGEEPNLALVYALVCNNHGAVLNSKGMVHRSEASKYAFKAIQSRERFLSRGDPEIQKLAMSYSKYANNLNGLNEPERAKRYFAKCLDIRENCPGATLALLEISYYNYAHCFWRNKQLREVIPYIDKAISVSKTNEPTTLGLYTRYLYANVKLMFFSEPDVAYQIHQSCLASRIALEGEGHYRGLFSNLDMSR